MLSLEAARDALIARELADLPDDEGMEDDDEEGYGGQGVLHGQGEEEEAYAQQQLQQQQQQHSDLRRCPRLPEPEEEEEEEEKEEEELPPAAAAAARAHEQHLRRRPPADAEEQHPHLIKRPRTEDTGHIQQQQQQQQPGRLPPPLQPPPNPSHAAIASAAHAHALQQQQHAGGVKQEEEAQQPAPAAPAQQQPSSVDGRQQVAMALRKLAAHLGNPTKFPKAAQLLRQLLDGDSLHSEHRPLVFDTLRATFPLRADRAKHLTDPALRRDVLKLLASVHARVAAGYFNRAEKQQVNEVYQLIGGTRNEMLTDDSFVFSKVLASVRSQIDTLPEEATEEDDDAYARVLEDRIAAHTQAAPSGSQQPQQQKQQEEQQEEQDPGARAHSKAQQGRPAAAAAAAADDPFGLDGLIGGGGGGGEGGEEDPFNLGALFEPTPAPAPKKAPKPPKPQEVPSKAWGATELQAARRRALLDSVHHSRTFHSKHAWAQTAVELLAEHCYKNKARFCRQQHEEVEELWRWVRTARAERKRGPSMREVNRDSTTFERTTKAWSTQHVPTKGKVGGQGDAKSNQWLG